jgi:hypothetical protein
MAVSRATVVQSLSIALIVFVMLTFVLAVTTYLFFTQTIRLEDEAKLAREDMAKANVAQTAAEGERDALKAASPRGRRRRGKISSRISASGSATSPRRSGTTRV